jgi:hypothetical protein
MVQQELLQKVTSLKLFVLFKTLPALSYLGTRADAQFVVAVDGATAQPTGEAYNSDTTPNSYRTSKT